MRGKHLTSLDPIELARLIPAYAGKTIRSERQREMLKAHPRVCGENCAGSDSRSAGSGSSPRMRGKPSHPVNAPFASRLIPAYAGKTF